MSDIIKKLEGQYTAKNRFEKFGNVLTELQCVGFRGVNASISFDFPITAIVGKNGSGKSTIAQLCLSGYRYRGTDMNSYDANDYYSIGSFFIKSAMDPAPYTNYAYVRYRYAISEHDVGLQQMSLWSLLDDDQLYSKENIIRKTNKEWGGYKNRPDRKTVYFGMGFFVPHHEMGDRIYLDPKTAIKDISALDKKSRKIVDNIIGSGYQSIEINTVYNQNRVAQIGFASRYGAKYSENHMGCGEGRLIRMVNALEQAPPQSLFVIEEPETALHQDAQHNFAMYLFDVCDRKRHQIVITTHSPSILDVLPIQARKMIIRNDDGTATEDNPTIAQIISEMSNGHQKSLLIYVEDDFSKLYLTEILRKFQYNLFNAVSIAFVGNTTDVLKAVEYTGRHKSISVMGVRDEKSLANPDKNLFAYPHETSPEVTIFNDETVATFVKEKYHYNVNQVTKHVTNHHKWIEKIANAISIPKDALATQIIQVYIDGKNEDYYNELLSGIKRFCK